jgi:hypothetical protein
VVTKRLINGMRAWFLIDCVLVLVAGLQLFVFSAHTARLFAWTIAPPLTAAFLGASYWASLPLIYLSSRRTAWADARLAVYGVLAFTILTTAATLLHLGRFHFAAAAIGARAAAWIWLLVYAIVPPVLSLLLAAQLRVPGADPPRREPVPPLVRLALGLLAPIMVAAGFALFVQAREWWPWPLTPLTARAVGGWLIGIGIIVAQAWWENDLHRIKPAMLAFAVLGALQLIAVARYQASIDWSRPIAFVYVGVLLIISGVGVLGSIRFPPRAV